MVSKAQVVELVNHRVTRILLVAQSSLPASQFQAFRTVVLNEFGRSGLERELERLEGHVRSDERDGEGRNT
ncbi:MAG TPA: hypothetical protein VK901_08085 [Nitrospiraceae bacterium]|nr:hypothetical protein [Nitrospiraceae bacterium]